MITIVNYKMGNIQSIVNAFEALGQKVMVADNPEDLAKADKIVIPGVGAFKEGMDNLRNMNFIEPLNKEVLENKKPFLGICLGMQLIAEKSHENGEHNGFGWLNFEVKKIVPKESSFRIPHMGWNDLKIRNNGGRLFKGVKEPAVVYFVHSYNLVPKKEAEKYITSICYHGQTITASLEKDNIFALQFHPEKSQNTGLTILNNFIKITKTC